MNKAENELQKYDYSPLYSRVSLTQFISLAKAEIANNAIYVVISIMSVLMFICIALSIFFVSFVASGFNLFSLLMMLPFIGVFILIAFLSLNNYRQKIITKYKMGRFASLNAIGFISDKTDPAYNGMIFNEGHSRVINYAYEFSDLCNSQVGSYSFTTGSGKNSKRHTYGYIVFDLPRNLPHILLDATGNNIMGLFSNLPTTFSRSQKLSLEGDFNKYFTLYAPKEYETDVLYIFTPDVMQSVVTMAKTYDIEIIDNKLYLYNPLEFNLIEKSELVRIQSLIRVLSKQFYQQSDYYADSTISNRSIDIVAPAGKRLNTSRFTTILSVLVFVVILYVWFNFSYQTWFIPAFIGINILFVLARLYYKKN